MPNLHCENFLKFWFPVILYSGIIFTISSLSRIEVPYAQYDLDKVVHVVEYAILGFLFRRAMSSTTKLSKKTVFWVTVIFCTLYGISDEFHQSFVPGRDATWMEALADTIGGTLGGLTYAK